MGWINIPNEGVTGFTGKPLRLQQFDHDMEPVYQAIYCPSAGCDYSTTNLDAFQRHLRDQHGKESDELSATLAPELEDATAATVVLGLLLRLSQQSSRDRQNPLETIRKTNDGYHSAEVWRRAYLAWTRNDPVIRLRQDQYEWLKQLLDRKLPLQKDAKERGDEQQTVAMHVYSLSEDAVRQALLSLPDRRKTEADPDEPEPQLAGTEVPSGRDQRTAGVS